MSEGSTTIIELSLKPIPPDTIATIKAELLPYIEDILQEQGKEELLKNGEISVEVEKTFPTDQAVVVVLTLLSNLAIEIVKTLILPKLKERYETKQSQSEKKRLE